MRQGRKAALLSVSDKTGLQSLGAGLRKLGFDLVATRSTAEHLRNAQIDCQDVEALTGFPPILDGRVKTLHPAVFAGILGRPDVAQDAADLAGVGSRFFDLVVCNLYPFEKHLAGGSNFSELVENIDIGGVSLLRAAAKNLQFVITLCRPSDYEKCLETLKTGDALELKDMRLALAQVAFSHTASYDAMISGWMAQTRGDAFPETKVVSLKKESLLRYGENPHQRAVVYSNRASDFHNLAHANSNQGKALSYNNLLDVEHALRLAREFKPHAAVILKHNTPCGVGTSEHSLEEAFVRAYECDTKSPFGGIVCTTSEISESLAQRMSEIFLEVVVAPSFSQGAADVFARKKNLRLLQLDCAKLSPRLQIATDIDGGMLVQDYDDSLFDDAALKNVTKVKPNAKQLAAMRLAFSVVKHVRSNAIVLANEHQTVAIAGGFTNRVDAVKACLERAQISLEGCVLASDAFFPFPDSIELLKGTGVSAVIQPGGSVQDGAVIAACDTLGLSMTFTSMRHFKH